MILYLRRIVVTGSRTRSQAARAERARATRERIVEAAAPLFVERGYLETTMADLARGAGVAVQTLYLSFGSKAAVLEAALGAVGKDHPSGWSERLRAAADGTAGLGLHVGLTTAAVERRHPLDAVLRGAAADPEPASLLAATRRDALETHARAVDELAEKPGFTDLISVQRATDVVATLLSPETYGLLVVDQGWTTPDWSEWALRHLVADLFPGARG
jgi:AcrR family transcriptional regulator